MWHYNVVICSIWFRTAFLFVCRPIYGVCVYMLCIKPTVRRLILVFVWLYAVCVGRFSVVLFIFCISCYYFFVWWLLLLPVAAAAAASASTVIVRKMLIVSNQLRQSKFRIRNQGSAATFRFRSARISFSIIVNANFNVFAINSVSLPFAIHAYKALLIFF